MGNIVLLDDLTINKIAAGEVIERPASVIKEMVENSIDAGATNIIVEIRNGGISYIRVTDNGKGIPEDDMEMAFERHATSKIRSAEDLNTVKTMGFRGEALASIAAIARVEMVSKTANQLNGYKVVVEGGKILNKTEAGCGTGTTITVSNLFYNTPVRYKFLKKDYTEAGYIEDAITRIALVHPEISIKLVNSGKTVIQTSGNGDIKTVIYSIYGKDIAEGIIDTDYTYENIHVYGVIGKPEIARSNRASQIFFVNKRYIKDKALSSAVERAYKGMLQAGKFGFLVLNIDMDPNKVDVNVHPAKLEVRFEDENTVFKAVYHAIKEALEKSQMMPKSEKIFDEDIMTMKQVPTPTPIFNKEETRTKPRENGNETIVEQIFRARQEKALAKAMGEDKNDKREPAPNAKFENDKKEPAPNAKFENDKKEPAPNVTNVPNVLEKGEEVIKKLQEMKDKLLQETKKTHEKISEETTPYSLETKKEVEAVIENQVEEPLEEPQEKVEQKVIQEEQKAQKTEQNIEEQPVQPTEQNTEEQPTQPTEQVLEEQPVEQVQEKNQDFEKMYMKMFGTKPVEEKKEEIKEEPTLVDIAQTENISVFDNVEEYKRPEYKFIGLAFENYIIIQIEQDMYILNQKYAQEKIIYEKLKQDYYNNNNNSQLLLLPDIINLSRKEMEIARDNMQIFREAGFSLEEFGENTIKLSGVPEECVDLETKEMFIEILNGINSVARTEKQEIIEKLYSIVASKVAETLKIATSKEEAYELIDQLYRFKEPFTNSQGKPIAIKMSRYDIERKFARK